MSKIFITSDLHFCHNKPFIYEPRGFSSVYEMNEEIIRRWNEVVSWDDTVYLLGDVMLNNNYEGCKYLNRLAGNIYILTGNHDTLTRIQEYVNIRPTILHLGLAYILKYQGYHFYLSHYQTITTNFDDDKPLRRKILNIHGHTHSKEIFSSQYPGCYNCALDAHNCFPISLDKIISDYNDFYTTFQGQK